MKIVSSVVLAILFSATVALPADAAPVATPPVQATLALPYASILPGVPFDVVVTFTNTSKHSASVGAHAFLIATLPDGSTFKSPKSSRLEPAGDDAFFTLGAGETAVRAVTWRTPGTPLWSSSPDLAKPGEYDLTLEIVADEDDQPNDYVGPVRTTAAHLVRRVNEGEDAAIWTKMQQVGKGQWPDDGFYSVPEARALVDEIKSVHPASAYYPYALLLTSEYPVREDVERSYETAKRFPQSPAYAHLLTNSALAAWSFAGEAERSRDLRGASDLLNVALARFDAAIAAAPGGMRTELEGFRSTVAARIDKVAAKMKP